MDRNAQLGLRIKQARKERRMTSEQLAEACNINASYLRQIESGAKMPSLPVFISICNALTASPSFLLADSLKNNEIQGAEDLVELQKVATPFQMNLITSMIRSALAALQQKGQA